MAKLKYSRDNKQKLEEFAVIGVRSLVSLFKQFQDKKNLQKKRKTFHLFATLFIYLLAPIHFFFLFITTLYKYLNFNYKYNNFEYLSIKFYHNIAKKQIFI